MGLMVVYVCVERKGFAARALHRTIFESTDCTCMCQAETDRSSWAGGLGIHLSRDMVEKRERDGKAALLGRCKGLRRESADKTSQPPTVKRRK